MLTRGDDYPLHQTPEPILYAGSDRRFYERYFFNGYSKELDLFFALGMGIYPAANLIDASFCVTLDGVQHNVHASRVLDFERMAMQVGPIGLEILEPLERLRFRVDDAEHGIRAELTFCARVRALEEPRQTMRQGGRTVMDCTRLTQHGSYSGWIEIRGRRIEVTPDRFLGTRDRSWGVRILGAPDAQPILPAFEFQTYFIWVQLNFEELAVSFGTFEDAQGRPWMSHGALLPVGGGEPVHVTSGKVRQRFRRGTRHATSAAVELLCEGGRRIEIALAFQPLQFYMMGLGYLHPEWGHGMYKGPLAVGYESLSLGTLNEGDFLFNHVEACCRARMTESGSGTVREGIGVMEQLIVGPHAPSGFKELMDVAGAGAIDDS